MGNRLMKTISGVPPQENQRAVGNKGALDPQPASETSSGKAQATTQARCAEVLVGQIAQEEKEANFLVLSEGKERERPQAISQESGETPSITANLAPELDDSATEIILRADAQLIGRDVPCEQCQLLFPEESPKASPKTYDKCPSTGRTSAVSAEGFAVEPASVVTLPVGLAELVKDTEGLRSPTGLSNKTEAPESDWKLPCEAYLEPAVDNAQGAAEEQAAVQRELEDAAFAEAQQRMGELCPDLLLTVPCKMGLEHTQGGAEEPTSIQRQLGDEASLDKAVQMESHPDSEGVEKSDGPLAMGTTPGMRPLAEEQAMGPEDRTIPAQPLEEVAMPQSSDKALPEVAETMKELEEACPDQPVTEVAAAKPGNPEVHLPPEPASISSNTLPVVHGEKGAGSVAAPATSEAAGSWAWARALEAQDSQVADEQTEEGPGESPKWTTEKEVGDLEVLV